VSRPDPKPGQLWLTSRERTVEIVAREIVAAEGDMHYGREPAEIDSVAYKFLGGSMIHLRSVSSLTTWRKVGSQ
jgi:hypothetical protein